MSSRQPTTPRPAQGGTPPGGGGADDTAVTVILGAVLAAAAVPAALVVVHNWAMPWLKSSSSSAAKALTTWWDANWWLVAFWAAAAAGLLVYRQWIRRRTRARQDRWSILAAGLAKVMGGGWDPAQHLRVRGWRGTRPVVVRTAMTGHTPVTDREWRLTVSAAARQLLGTIEPIRWPEAAAGGTTSWRRLPWLTLRAAVPPPGWRRVVTALWKRMLRRGDGDDPGPGGSPEAAAAELEERLVATLAGLVPRPRPRVGEGRIVVGYGETTRDQSPAWRARVVDQVSARLGCTYRAIWDRQARRFSLEPVPALPHPIPWAERTAVLRTLDTGRWVAGYGTDENGDIVAWEPGDREPHALFSGDPGTGKTESMKALIDTLLLLGCMVAIIDPKQRDFAEYLGRPGVVCVATAVEDQVGALVDLDAEMMRRTAASALRRLERQYPHLEDGRYHAAGRPAQAAIDEVPLIVVLDELTMHTQQVQEWWQRLAPPQRAAWGAEKSRTAPMLLLPARIVALARAIKIHMLIGVQRPDASNFGGSSTMRDNVKHMASMGSQSPIGSEMQWGDRRTGSEIEVEHPGEGISNGLRISPQTGARLSRGTPGRFKAWYAADTAETEEFWAAVTEVAPDASLVRLPHVSDAARIPSAAADALRRRAYDTLAAAGGGGEPIDQLVDQMGGRSRAESGAAVPSAGRPLTLVPPLADPTNSPRSDHGPDRHDPDGQPDRLAEDELLRRAAELVVERDQGSAAMLQRELRIGYERGRQLMEQLEVRSVVGPVEGRKARKVLATAASLAELFGDPPHSAKPARGAIPPVSLTVVGPPEQGRPGDDPPEGRPIASTAEPVEVDERGDSWAPAVPAEVAEGDTVQFGDLADATVLDNLGVVVDDFDGAELVRLVLEVGGEEQTVDLSEDEVIYRRDR